MFVVRIKEKGHNRLPSMEQIVFDVPMDLVITVSCAFQIACTFSTRNIDSPVLMCIVMRHRIRLFRSRTLSFVFKKDVDSVNLRSDEKVTVTHLDFFSSIHGRFQS